MTGPFAGSRTRSTVMPVSVSIPMIALACRATLVPYIVCGDSVTGTQLGAELPSTRYRDNKGRDKRVRYWAMEPLSDDGFIPNAEIDDIRWLPVPEAVTLLSYEHDRPVVDAFEPPPSG